ncbi:unnamed protein product [Caenorhabditis bovis]|uniref:CCD97-like C-terminal domain-containing protein n=1 Tax=Caenorhabditis bovis TaxID=2654633 RepID=A0A8S1E057_9PELO|nr:unnamed protein product [Caenorhabditis bovis]
MESLIVKLASLPDIFVQHQKIGEKDFTEKEKYDILQKLAQQNPSVFLTRYAEHMSADDCLVFENTEDPFISSMLQQIRAKKEPTKREKKNRRFNKMQKLLKEGSFFSDLKMREREPYLYDAMVGRFLNEAERIQLRPTVNRDGGECSWSDMMSRFEDSQVISERRNVQETEWEPNSSTCHEEDRGHDHSSRFFAHVSNRMAGGGTEFIPEEDGDDDEDEDDDITKLRKEMEKLAKLEASQYDELGDQDTPAMLRSEFESYMQQRFLAGKDHQFFDYSTCDNINEIDPIKERDDEERWFDKD